METMLSDGNVVEKLAKLKTKDKSLWQKIKAHFNAMGSNPSVEAAAIQECVDGAVRYVDGIVELFDKVAVQAVENYQARVNAQKNTATDGGVQNQARASTKFPDVLDPRTVTREDVFKMLVNVKAGKYKSSTYIPVRTSTPGIVQERLFADDLPVIMPVSKVVQAFSKDNGPVKGKNKRGHQFSEDDLINIIERMDSPDFVYSQEDGRGVEVIKMGDNADGTVVIVEFDNNVNPAYMNGYEGGTYNVSVTMFDVDGGNVGLFMYGQDKGWHEVFNKEKEGDPAKKFPATRPFAIEQDSLDENVSQYKPEVNKKFSDRDSVFGVQHQARPARYDYSKPFDQQIDDYKKGIIHKGDTLVVGATPDVYQSIGFNSLPMTINTTHVDYALNGTKDADHYLGESVLKQLPDSIKNPVAVFVSQTQNNTSVVALLPFQVNRKQAIAPVYIDGFGQQNGIRIDSNALTSVFGKTNALSKLLLDAINEETSGKFSLLYWNKKEATTLLQRAGLQLPGRLIPRDGFIHSIRESASPVKPKFENVTESQQFKRWFGDWQKHPQNASKVVNADGTPKVMYHGTSAYGFTTFDTYGGRFGLFGKGSCFTEDKSVAESYTEKGDGSDKGVYEVYLNIRNPLG